LVPANKPGTIAASASTHKPAPTPPVSLSLYSLSLFFETQRISFKFHLGFENKMKMKKNGPEKIDQLQKQRKNSSDGQSVKGVKSTTNRFLITVNVLGSAGPLRFVVNENDLVAAVIDTALKSYAREGRLPVLGSDVNDFVLYCSDAGFDGIYACFQFVSF
jgi:hypothetical protein